MNDKHFAMLGSMLHRMMENSSNKKLEDVEIGKAVYIYIQHLENEAQRDARDEANGKGA